MALREIRTFDDEILRKKSKNVEKVDNKIRDLLNDMAETMYNTPNGGGLAGCQVGILKRLVVIDLGEGLIKLVNPEIIKEEGEQIVVEGCLSFPDVWGKLKRPKKVTVQALNENGEKIIIKGSGLMAKCLCHEIDHLDGIVFTDKIIERVKL
ncbi:MULTISPECIES: peptide deformylase [unclassified Clostridioides]|uniref:peptide deformylase n=1 Tax=unclassified Clostridioides TaxID=2635829 RepID=UPI001D0C49BE|nr:peptide deformylase [Clostridioides sp. ES-S-0049-03]MCC0653615.1 peptide deformylase [Clostridioides sp. ES-S-0001-03]MCC0655362.1 peptide deformylase [Clostridioides sp. ES-S-0123-01]MCC0671337.1 peptide deformylase [Clostridioides sp. ES-S-0145-01]MCC0674855.1 peptide deformylase [Clostridioides sp. ES-W-0018-02]MCC0679385.1 peptide deformylase [Clostridioides sp. ES-S-0005-03]MCC0696468.1 peptide deformylase [Clostridioides sp. ES-S-0048-02]MCC0702456.1 peptide deformylase [Clostridio